MTNDIAMALRTPTQSAEEIKIKYGCALASLAGESETIKVPSVGERDDRDLSRQALAEVIEPRYEELFTLIQGSFVVVVSRISFLRALFLQEARQKWRSRRACRGDFHMPVSIGKPKSVAGLSDIVRNPIYATSVGLLQYGLGNAPQSHGAHRSETQSGSVWQSVKSWLLGQ